MDVIPMFVPQLLLLFLAALLIWFVGRAFAVLRHRTQHENSHAEQTKSHETVSLPSNPFLQSDVAETEQPAIVVQSPILPKKEFFVMRADSKTASILGGESSDIISRRGEIVDMGDMSQEKQRTIAP